MILPVFTKRYNRQDNEAILGAVVLGLAALLLALVYGHNVFPQQERGGLSVTAKFRYADGILVGSDVRLSGMVVGKVIATSLDSQFRAVTMMRLTPGLDVPVDTAAAIESDSLLGAKYIELKLGGDDAMVKQGGELTYTQDSLTFEKLMDMILAQARARRGYVGKTLPKVL